MCSILGQLFMFFGQVWDGLKFFNLFTFDQYLRLYYFKYLFCNASFLLVIMLVPLKCMDPQCLIGLAALKGRVINEIAQLVPRLRPKDKLNGLDQSITLNLPSTTTKSPCVPNISPCQPHPHKLFFFNK